ncbi:MAG: DeoR family transcriptional regulator [Capsulimonadaceae bacterium]
MKSANSPGRIKNVWKLRRLWVVFRKDRLTDEILRGLGLSERQIKAVRYVQQKGKISYTEYRELVGVSRRTAVNDLTDLDERGILETARSSGRSVHYTLVNTLNAQNQ